jgi:hypothetical protein
MSSIKYTSCLADCSRFKANYINFEKIDSIEKTQSQVIIYNITKYGTINKKKGGIAIAGYPLLDCGKHDLK